MILTILYIFLIVCITPNASNASEHNPGAHFAKIYKLLPIMSKKYPLDFAHDARFDNVKDDNKTDAENVPTINTDILLGKEIKKELCTKGRSQADVIESINRLLTGLIDLREADMKFKGELAKLGNAHITGIRMCNKVFYGINLNDESDDADSDDDQTKAIEESHAQTLESYEKLLETTKVKEKAERERKNLKEFLKSAPLYALLATQRVFQGKKITTLDDLLTHLEPVE